MHKNTSLIATFQISFWWEHSYKVQGQIDNFGGQTGRQEWFTALYSGLKSECDLFLAHQQQGFCIKWKDCTMASSSLKKMYHHCTWYIKYIIYNKLPFQVQPGFWQKGNKCKKCTMAQLSIKANWMHGVSNEKKWSNVNGDSEKQIFSGVYWFRLSMAPANIWVCWNRFLHSLLIPFYDQV